MKIPEVHHLKSWIDEHRHLLKPPVGNAQVYQQTKDFIVMIVGGPNSRKDFHYNETEEFFYQIEGDITLKVREENKTRDVTIREGEIFLLPAKVPHSPRRPANTIGMVVEKIRTSSHTDGLLWFCENCGNKLYEEYFPLEDIVKQLPPIINKFHNSVELRTCDNCSTVMDVPRTDVPRTDVPRTDVPEGDK